MVPSPFHAIYNVKQKLVQNHTSLQNLQFYIHIHTAFSICLPRMLIRKYLNVEGWKNLSVLKDHEIFFLFQT